MTSGASSEFNKPVHCFISKVHCIQAILHFATMLLQWLCHIVQQYTHSVADCPTLVWVWCVVPSPTPADHLDNSRGRAAGCWATAVWDEIRAHPGEPAAHEEHQGDV